MTRSFIEHCHRQDGSIEASMTMDAGELDIAGRAYARQIMAVEAIEDARCRSRLCQGAQGRLSRSRPVAGVALDEPVRHHPKRRPGYLYTDDAVGILPERRLNNGVPSFHARLISSVSPQPGEHVVHVGYYTAILAELVERSGAVTAIDSIPGWRARGQILPNIRMSESKRAAG